MLSWTEEPGGLLSMGSQKAGHDCATEHTRSMVHGGCPYMDYTVSVS